MKHLHTRLRKCIAPCIFFLFLLPFKNPCYAQIGITDSDGIIQMLWYYKLTGASEFHSGVILPGKIYDDYDFVQYQYHSTDAILWNCGRTFLITTYTAPDDSVELTFSTNEGAPFASCACRDFYIYPDGSTTPLQTTLGVLDDTGSVYFSSAVQGLYDVKVFQHGADPASATPLLAGTFLLLPKIKQVWIDAAPVCAGSYTPGTFYHFTVHTDPPMSAIMNPPGDLGPEPLGGFGVGVGTIIPALCEPFFPYTIGFNFSVTDPCYYEMSVFNAPVTSGTFNEFNINFPYHADDSDFYIDYGEIDSISDPAAHCYGTPANIGLTFFDGVATTFAVNAPVFVLSPALPAVAGDPSGTPAGPPNATGMPAVSYDIYNYTVSGYELWTPDSNPVAALYGSDVRDSVIRIQNNLDILGGGQLVLSNNMRLEMGPGATITIEPNTDTTAYGGFLVMGGVIGSAITAYRGCGGTDTSLWGGIFVNGIPTMPAGTTIWGDQTPQGRLSMSNSEISYATIGVINGDLGEQGGIIKSWGGNKFYNNKSSALLWDYTPAVPVGKLGTLLNFTGTQFINDSTAWFTPTYMVRVADAGPVNLGECTFTNATGHTVADAVWANEGSVLAGTSVFNNFTNGVNSNSASGTHGLNVHNCTFNNCHMGIVDHGSVAPLLSDNIFNIPAYSGAGPSYYSSSNVLVVDDQNVGILLNGTTGYNLTANTFQTTASGSTFYNYTSGALCYGTGSDHNLVTNSNFTGLGAAMLSNFDNRGLQYSCNTDAHVHYDISSLGTTSIFSLTSGIYNTQGTSASGTGPFTYPAGNVFSGTWNLFNTELPYVYYYDATGSQIPSAIYAPGFSAIIAIGLTSSAHCYPAPGTLPYALTGSGLTFATVAANVGYYMSGACIVPHRDSIYYWAGQLGAASGALLITNLLIEDGFTDSASNLYSGIIYTYTLDSAETNEYVQGAALIDLLIYKKVNSEPLFTLTSDEITTLQSVKASTSMWAHARAEAWLYAYEGDAMTDTLLYPNAPDSSENGGNNGGGGRHAGGAHSGAAPALANQVYPNPVHDFLQVVYTANSTEEVQIRIEDVSGRTIITQSIQSGTPAAIDMSKLSSGMYLYQISEGVNVVLTGKVAKD